MNVVGSIGQFFINYQVEIEGTVFVLLILLTIYLFVKYIGRDKKNEAKIAELSAKLENIESQVTGRAPVEGKNDASAPIESKVTTDFEAEKEAITEGDADADDIALPLEAQSVDMSTASGSLDDAVMLGPKFTDRDWSKDRLGNVYSEEALREQIG